MPIKLDVVPTLDQSAAKKAANSASTIFANASKGIGSSLTSGLSGAESEIRKLSRDYQRMYDKAADSAGKLLVEEKKLEDMRDKGVSGTRLIQQVERVNAARRNEARQIRETTDAYHQLNNAQRNTNRGSSFFSDFGSSASAHFKSSFTDGLKGGALGGAMAGAVTGALSSITGTISAAGHALANTFISAIESSIDKGINLQRVTNEFQGVTRATPAQTAAMKAKAMELGSDPTLPGVSTEQTGKAMTELAKNGFTVEESMKAVRGVMELATAAQIDGADAAVMLGDAISMFQLRAEDATRVADMMASAVNASSITMRDLQLALSMGGSMAHGFGMSIDQTTAAIAALGKMGIKSSDAGTLLKTMLKQLTEPSDEVAQAMNELGLTISDNQGKFVGFESILGQLSRAARRMPEMKFNSLSSTAFGSDAIRGAIFAAKGGDQIYRDMAQAVTRVGAAHEMAAAQMQGWPGVIEGIKNSIEGMQLRTFDAIDAIAKGFGPGITNAFDKVGNWMEQHQPEMIKFFTGLGIAALEVGKSFIVAGDMVLVGLEPMVKGITGVVDTVFKATGNLADGLSAALSKLPSGMLKAFGLEGASQSLKDFSATMSRSRAEIQGLSHSFDQLRDGLHGAEGRVDSWITALGNAGTQAAQAAEFTRALGKAHAEMRGMDIIVTDNTPEVTNRIEKLGLKVEQLPHGEVKVTANTAAGQQILDAMRRSITNTPVNMPIRPVLTDYQDFNTQMRQWLWNKSKGLEVGGMPQFSPNTGPTTIGGNNGGSWFNRTHTAAPSVGPALPEWAAPIPPKKPKGGGGGGGGASAHGSGNDVFSYNVDDAIAYAYAQNGKPYQLGGVGPTFFDCSGFISDVYAVLTGKPYQGNERYFTTESNFAALGFERGYQEGGFNIGVRHGGPGGGHMAATLPNGVNIESGGSGGGVRYGNGAAGAKDFQEQWHIATGRGGSSAMPVSVQNFGSQAQGSLGQIGTSLSDAFGLREGLPGLFKWITGFVANLAFAPAYGALSAVKQAAGPGNGGGGMFGLMGGPGIGGGGMGAGLSSGGVSGMAGGLPSMLAGMAGQTPGAGPGMPSAGDIHGVGMPGMGSAFGAAEGGYDPNAGSIGTAAMGQPLGPGGLKTPNPIGRQMGKDAPQGGGMSFSGGLMGAAAGAAGSMMPGAGAGAQIAMDMMGRTAGYISQLGGIAASGALETIMLSDTSAADFTNTMLGRIITGVAGAKPQLPNTAGAGGQGVAGSTQGQPSDPVHQQGQQPQRPWVNIENQTIGNGMDANANNRQMAREMKSADAAQGAKRA